MCRPSPYAVVTASPGPVFAPVLTFWETYEAAYQHAFVINRDLNRDAWVVRVEARLYAGRRTA